MKYFIGITLPKETAKRIASFQKSFSSNELPKILEPHITIKTKNGLAEDLNWLDKIRPILENYPKFEVVLDGVGIFGDSVVIIRVLPSREITTLHKALFNAIKPNEQDVAKKYFENEKYEAHITLGMNSWGMTKEELVVMKEKGSKKLTDIPKFNVTFIRIFQQINLNDAYKKFLDIPLYETK
jgi:2'-5' RNA ligase